LTSHKVKILLATTDWTRDKLAAELGMSRSSIGRRLHDHKWKRLELEKLSRILAAETEVKP